MAYKSSPRPSFGEPTLIPYDKVTRDLWGDEAFAVRGRSGEFQVGLWEAAGLDAVRPNVLGRGRTWEAAFKAATADP